MIIQTRIKHVSVYICEFCKKEYDSEIWASACEEEHEREDRKTKYPDWARVTESLPQTIHDGTYIQTLYNI